MNSLTPFLLGLGFNLTVTALIVWCIYYPTYRDKEYVLTFFALNTSIFLITFLLSDTNLKKPFWEGISKGIHFIYIFLSF